MADLTFPEPTLLYDFYPVKDLQGFGLIAGFGEGIVTVAGEPSSRRIVLFNRDNMRVEREQWSASDGSYLFPNLDPEKQYLMVGLDHQKQYEPVAYDFIKPYIETDT